MKYKMVKSVSFKEFVSFLKNNNCYKQFRENFSTPFNDESFRYLVKRCFSQKVALTTYSYWRVLGGVFKWKDTKEGYDFWRNVRNAWEKEYNCWD